MIGSCYAPTMRGAILCTLGITLATVACGGNGSNATDGAPRCDDDWCKGDPAGTWNLDGDTVCLSEPIGVSSCPDMTCELVSATASGTLALPPGGDGASAQFTAEGTLDCAVPTACLGMGGCADLPGTCTATAGGCDCTIPLTSATDIQGVWRLDADLGLLSIDNEAENSQWATTSYCAPGKGTLDLGLLSMQSFSTEIGLVPVHLRVRATPG